jgi:hypothetical protein
MVENPSGIAIFHCTGLGRCTKARNEQKAANDDGNHGVESWKRWKWGTLDGKEAGLVV